MNQVTPDSYFDALEANLNQLAIAVAEGDVSVLPALSEQVQQLTVNLVGVWDQWQRQGLANGALNLRIKVLGDDLQIVRANLLRRATLVEQALSFVVPVIADPTYAGSGTYGAGPKASGRLAAISA